MKSDRDRWNSRYYEDSGKTTPPPDQLLTDCSYMLSSGRALDLACGKGGNSIFVARLGYWVDSLDISFTALRILQAQVHAEKLPIGCAVVDLDYYLAPVNFYDLIMIFYFFSSNLMSTIRSALKPGGLLIYATFNYNHKNIRPNFCDDYLVPPGGLGKFFPDLEAVMEVENYGPDGNISRFVGKGCGWKRS
ncbi:MAG: class I SAM-dependent methyltransferase [Desulfomonilaceae bacterium]